MKSLIKTILITLLILLFSGNLLATAKADAVSAASKQNYYTGSSLTGNELLEALKNRELAISVATVNGDGTPNAAVVIPGVVDSEILMFGLADNQTKINFVERKLAVITAYKYDPTAESKAERNVGARIVVEYIDDEAEIEDLMARTGAGTGTMFVRILKILPIG